MVVVFVFCSGVVKAFYFVQEYTFRSNHWACHSCQSKGAVGTEGVVLFAQNVIMIVGVKQRIKCQGYAARQLQPVWRVFEDQVVLFEEIAEP